MNSAYDQQQRKDIEPARAKSDSDPIKLEGLQKSEAVPTSTVTPHTLAPHTSDKGALEVRDVVKDPDALMQRSEARKAPESDGHRLTGALSALTEFPPELYQNLKKLEAALERGVSHTEFQKMLDELVPDAAVKVQVTKLARRHLTEEAPSSAVAETTPSTT